MSDLDENSTEESKIIEEVLGYCASGGTHLQPDVMFNPVEHYTSASQLDKEMRVLFRDFPIIVAHSSQLDSAGQYITHNDTGVPLLVTRNRDRQIKAFINVCRHRGARVANEPCGKANTFACPYHSWTYDLNGALRGLPHADNFGTIDRASHGLVEVPAFERFGLVWVRPSAPKTSQQTSQQTTSSVTTQLDIDGWLAPMAEQLQSLDLASHSLFKSWSIERDMSWRIALEGFQESYHFCSAHKHTACSTYLDNQSVFLDKYPHVRHAVPLARAAELGTVPNEEWDYRSNFMTQNYLFPCNFVQVMTDHVYIHSIFPKGPGRCVFQCLMLIPEPAQTAKAERYWAANYEVVRTVFDEDFAIGEGIQQGFAAGVNDNFLFGRYEAGLHMGQKAILDALEGKLKVPVVK